MGAKACRTHSGCLGEMNSKLKDTDSLKINGWNELCPNNSTAKAKVAVLISDSIDFQKRRIARDKKEEGKQNKHKCIMCLTAEPQNTRSKN